MKGRNLPLYLFGGYVLITLLTAIWGPVILIGLNTSAVAAYMSLFLLMFCSGYLIGSTLKVKVATGGLAAKRNVVFKRVVLPSIYLAFIFKLYEFADALIGGNLSLSFSSLGQNYVDTYSSYVRGSGGYGISYVVGLFFYFPLLVSLILGPYFFGHLTRNQKAAVILTIFLIIIVNTLGQGKQKQIGDIFIFLSSVAIVRFGKKLNNSAQMRRIKYRKGKYYLAAALAAIMFVSAFVAVLDSRYNALGIDVSNISAKQHNLIQYDLDHAVFEVFGDRRGFALTAFSGYLSGGYLGLSLSFEQPFEWTYGFGHSYAMTVLFGKLIGLPISVEDSYPYRVGETTGWGVSKWHSVFPWLASDLSFPGVLVFFFFFAFVYGKCWREAVIYHNPLSVLLFAVLNLGLVFVPANNQLFHTPESFIAVVSIFFMWLTLGRKLNSTMP